MGIINAATKIPECMQAKNLGQRAVVLNSTSTLLLYTGSETRTHELLNSLAIQAAMETKAHLHRKSPISAEATHAKSVGRHVQALLHALRSRTSYGCGHASSILRPSCCRERCSSADNFRPSSEYRASLSSSNAFVASVTNPTIQTRVSLRMQQCSRIYQEGSYHGHPWTPQRDSSLKTTTAATTTTTHLTQPKTTAKDLALA